MTVTYPITDISGKLTPYVPVVLLHPITGKSWKAKALLDTGADTCTLPSYVATSLGYDMSTPSTNSTKGVGGVNVATWQHDFVIGLLDPTEKIILKMNARSSMNCVGHNDLPVILGTNNFLKDFKITIDYPSKTITLVW